MTLNKQAAARAGAALALLLAAGLAWGQGTKIYTCVDSKGKRLTSDRPIAECVDREQKELNPSGTVRRTVEPSLTAAERAAKEERERKADEERQRQAEERRRDRAMLQRYPTQAAHDLERSKALAAVQDVVAAAQLRTQDLKDQRKKLLVETEFYAKDPSKMPAKLRRELEENQKHIDGQQRFMANQEDEKKRVNARFDEDLKRLKVLWAQMAMLPGASAAAPSPPPATPAPATAAKR